MSLLDRYIAKSYLMNVVKLLTILFCFVVVVDVSINLDRFSNAATEVAGSQGEQAEGLAHVVQVAVVVADLWWPRLLMLFNFLIGLVMVGAMGFTCAQMVRHWEFVAVLASGQSLHRVWKPILIVSFGLLLLQAANQQWVMPRVAPLLTRDAGDAGKHGLDQIPVPLTTDGDNRVFHAARFDPQTEQMQELTIFERSSTGQAIRTIHADLATWNGIAWILEGLEVTLHDRSIIGLGSPSFIETNLSPTELKRLRFASFGRNLSWSQIGAMIARNRDQARQRRQMGDSLAASRLESRAADLDRIRFARVAVMCCSMLTIVICLPLFVTRDPKNMVVQSLKCAPLAMTALMGSALGAEAPIGGIAPQIAPFLPVLVLSPIAVLTASGVRT